MDADEIWKLVGGLPGLVGLLAAATAIFWRTRFPQIGIDYLKAELDRNREEITIADGDRRKLRDDLKGVRDAMADLERRYLESLQEKEVIAHELRQVKRLLKELQG